MTVMTTFTVEFFRGLTVDELYGTMCVTEVECCRPEVAYHLEDCFDRRSCVCEGELVVWLKLSYLLFFYCFHNSHCKCLFCITYKVQFSEWSNEKCFFSSCQYGGYDNTV